ncbi:general transcription factor II-I repeat domain-containing protein 2A-like [Macrobrachium nipponense]|uniref:general transcription factor II-I repeat domain-containing protein 2A-like n=1 Tax=Macrobrachium nipponense TaxID=159736 RepID=UPI0030C87746
MREICEGEAEELMGRTSGYGVAREKSSGGMERDEGIPKRWSEYFEQLLNNENKKKEMGKPQRVEGPVMELQDTEMKRTSSKMKNDVLKKFENISLNRMTVQRRIVDLSGDIVDQLKEKSKQFVYFSLATDESTDVTSTAQLLVFVRGVTEDFSFMRNSQFYQVTLSFASPAIQAISDEIEAEYGDLVFFTQIRWLSRGNTLKRFISLLDEIEIFLNEKNKIVPELTNADWLCDLSFLVDLTSHLNNLNHKLQGNNQLISQLANYVTAFEQKLKLFQLQIVKGELGHFPNYKLMCEKHKVCNRHEYYAAKLGKLLEAFESRFEDLKKEVNDLKLFSNPFSVSPDEVEFEAQIELIDLQNNDSLRTKYNEGDLLNFIIAWPKIKFSLF